MNGNVSINSTNPFHLTVAAPATLNILSSTDWNIPSGDIINFGTVNSSGTVNNNQFNNNGILNNSGQMANFALGNAAGATINNSGTLVESQKAVVNQGTFNNSGGMLAAGYFNDAGATTTNTGTMVFKAPSAEFQAQVENSSTFTNQSSGLITNTGIFTNDAGATLTNSGTFDDQGQLANKGTFNNKGTYIADGGVGFNQGQLNNTGTLKINALSEFENFGSIDNSQERKSSTTHFSCPRKGRPSRTPARSPTTRPGRTGLSS